ncbi:amino acid adenylation domain-containing protein [Streptacidiphilus sp. 4-A2]|nr:amino acid adenylation domain-containing protein [Streptacidiphilus sp. 4-A2]
MVVRTGPGGQERLIGYVVPAGGGPVPADLRVHLAGRLPAYLLRPRWLPSTRSR